MPKHSISTDELRDLYPKKKTKDKRTFRSKRPPGEPLWFDTQTTDYQDATRDLKPRKELLVRNPKPTQNPKETQSQEEVQLKEPRNLKRCLESLQTDLTGVNLIGALYLPTKSSNSRRVAKSSQTISPLNSNACDSETEEEEEAKDDDYEAQIFHSSFTESKNEIREKLKTNLLLALGANKF
jgi:hypothetical protein